MDLVMKHRTFGLPANGLGQVSTLCIANGE